jgi:methylmalonyl-CoA mutase
VSPLAFLKLLQGYCLERGFDCGLLKGSVGFYPVESGRGVAVLLGWADAHFPCFKVVCFDFCAFHSSSEDSRGELVSGMGVVRGFLMGLDVAGRALAVRHCQLEVAVGVGYFIEIAKFRALRILWAGLVVELGVAPCLACIHGVAFPDVGRDANANKIRATTQAMSGVLGGVDRLTVVPSGDGVFHTRIARNVQHLLKLEGYLDRVVDPAGGSYYIEVLTGALV